MVPFFSGPFATLAFEVVAKSIKALNHEGHEEHKEELFFSFVLFVSFVVPFFSGPFNNRLRKDDGQHSDSIFVPTSKAGMTVDLAVRALTLPCTSGKYPASIQSDA